jgi:iron complex outermembrane receptor protein
MIDWVMYSADDIYHATSFNLDNVGASATATVNFDQWLGRRQPLSRLRLDYAYLYQHRRSGPEYFKSNYALEYLRHKMTVVLDHRIVSHLAATWSLRLQQREGSYLLYHNGQSTGEQHAYGTHALLDCKVHWDTPRYGLFVDLTNLTSHRYFDLANVRQPGFMVMAGASWRLP